MERELDLAFARVSPVAATGDDLEGLIQSADRSAFIEARPPVASRTAVLALVKKSERKLLGWYFDHVAQQVTSFAGATVRTLTVLADRVERVERLLPPTDLETFVPDSAEGLADGVVAGVVTAFDGVEGRVLVGGNGGPLLAALAAAGVDAYGVAVGAAPQSGPELEQRDGDPLTHLRDLAPESLGGAVLFGTDPQPTGTKLAHLGAASAAIIEGGRLVVLAGDPDNWGRDNPVEADLAPGRPWRPETWLVVMASQGFAEAEVTPAGACYLVAAVRRR